MTSPKLFTIAHLFATSQREIILCTRRVKLNPEAWPIQIVHNLSEHCFRIFSFGRPAFLFRFGRNNKIFKHGSCSLFNTLCILCSAHCIQAILPNFWFFKGEYRRIQKAKEIREDEWKTLRERERTYK